MPPRAMNPACDLSAALVIQPDWVQRTFPSLMPMHTNSRCAPSPTMRSPTTIGQEKLGAASLEFQTSETDQRSPLRTN